jgi:GntR family phosphonate transport system transcriptional regulator
VPRSPLWTSIAATLRAEIGRGHYRPGDKLPTEAELAARFGVNRHTVRRALADLAAAGLAHPRRGAGVFVAARPMDYPLGRRVRFHQNLAALGLPAAREVLRLETRHGDGRECAALGLAEGAPLHVFECVSLADGVPVALAASVFPAERLPGLLERLADSPAITQALAAEGVADYTRASTRITAKRASATQAAALRLAEGAPILRTEAVNVDAAGRPVEFGRTWFAGYRVALTVTAEPHVQDD